MASHLYKPLKLDTSDPAVPDSYQQTIEKGFRWLLKALLVWLALELTLGVPFFFVRKAASLLLGLLLATTYLIDLSLLRRGHFKAARWSFLLTTWLASFVVAILRGGLGGQYMVFLLATTIAAGWLLGGRSMILFSALALLSTLIIAVLQVLGFQFPDYFSGRHPVGVWMFFAFSLITAVVPLKYILESLRHSVSALRSSEADYRTLVHSIDGIVWEADLQTLRFTFVSKSAERILGYPLAEWTENPTFWLDHLHPQDRDRVMHLWGDSGQALGQYEFQFRMLTADGRTIWIHNNVHVPEEQEASRKLRGIMVDVSRHAQAEFERDQSEEALKLNQKELLEAQRVAQVGSWIWDPQTDEVTWSPELYRIAGFDLSLAAPSYEQQVKLYTPESWQRMERCVAQALITGEPYKLDLELIRPDGSTRWIVDHGEALRDETGRIVRLRGTAQDITERKRTENSLRLFRALIDESNDAIEVVDPTTLQFLDVNKTACSTLGYTRDELLSMTVCDIDPSVTDVVSARANLQKAGFLLREGAHKRSDGSSFPVEVGVRLIQLDRLYAVAVVRDITQRKNTEEALRRQQQTLHTLFNLAKTLTSTLDLSTTLDQLALQSLRVVNAESASASLREDYGFSVKTAFRGQFRERKSLRLQPNVGIPGWVVLNRATYLNNFADLDPLIPPELREPIPIRSVLCTPVFDAHSKVIALLALYNKRGGPFSPKDIELMEGLAQVASIALQNALAYRRARQAEHGLRRLSSRLINSQDEERHRIARELHETTAQDLAALRMCLGRVDRSATRLPVVSQDALRESLEISNKLISSIRTLAYLLHPPGLEEAGLETAFQWYASGFSRRSGIAVNVDLQQGMSRLPHEYETTLFRIMQECLTNVHNHSGSRRAWIRLSCSNGRVSMEVQDEGRGIPGWTDRFLSSDARIGVGIAGMRERVQQFHGDLKVESAPGCGTMVRVLIPVPGSRAKKRSLLPATVRGTHQKAPS